MYEQTILCLANSRKPPSGRCIAGKILVDGECRQWLRPVSARPTHEVSEAERRYQNGRSATLLDIVEIPLISAQPFNFQQENHVLDADYYWNKVGTASWDLVKSAVDDFDHQFWSHSLSTYHGVNDKISEDDVNLFQSSLKLIEVSNLEIRVQVEDGYQGRPGKRKVRGFFNYRGTQYLLSISDASLEDEYLHGENGYYPIGNAILCISLVEVYHGYSFRVIASVITRSLCETTNA